MSDLKPIAVVKIRHQVTVDFFEDTEFGTTLEDGTKLYTEHQVSALEKKLESTELSNAELAEQIDLNVVKEQQEKLAQYQNTFGTLLQAIFRLKAEIETYAYLDSPAQMITESLYYKELESAISKTESQVIREIKEVAVSDFVHDQIHRDNSLFASSLKERARVYLLGNRFDKRK